MDAFEKLSEIRTYLDILNKNFKHYGVFPILYQSISRWFHTMDVTQQKCLWRLLPVWFWYKLRCLTLSQCYLFQLVFYTGKSSKSPDDMRLGSKVVTNMLEAVSDLINHTVLLDNFLTSNTFIRALKEKSLCGAGTVPRNCNSQL